MQMVCQKKIREMHPVCLTRLAPKRFGGQTESREKARSAPPTLVVSAAKKTRGRATRRLALFRNAPPTRLARTANRRSTPCNGRQPSQGVIWRRRSPPARKTSTQSNRAGGSRPINGNPAAGKNSRAPAVFCRTVDIYS